MLEFFCRALFTLNNLLTYLRILNKLFCQSKKLTVGTPASFVVMRNFLREYFENQNSIGIGYKNLIMIPILLIIANFAHNFASAQTNILNSISLILAVDSSGSMKKTDPNFLRREASSLLIDLLASGDQIGIVEFSSNTNVVSPIITINSVIARQNLKARLNKLSVGANTRIDLALEEAVKLFKNSKSTNKAIILLSDGALDVDGSPVSAKSKKALEKLFTEDIKQLKDNNIKVYTISLSDKAADKNSQKLQQDLMTRLARDTNGFNVTAPSNTDLHKKFIDVLKELTDPPELLCIRENNYFKFQLDPTVKRVNIVVDKTNSPAAKLTIKSPDSEYSKSKENVISWSQSKLLDIITLLETPTAGEWKIYSSQNVDKLKLEIFADTVYKLAPISIKGKKQATERLTVSSQLLVKKSSTGPYEPVKIPDTELFLKVTTPKNELISVPLNNFKKGVYRGNYTPRTEGNYGFKVISTGQISRQTGVKLLNIIPAPVEDVKVFLDQNVYAIGEDIKLTIITQDNRVKFPNDFITLKLPSASSSDSSRLLKTKQISNKVYSVFRIKEKYGKGEYNFLINYFDTKGEPRQKAVIAYVIGKVDIVNSSLDYGKLSSKGEARTNLLINSELEQTNLPVNLEINNIEINSDKLKASDIRFKFIPEFFIKGAKNEQNLGIILSPGALKKLQRSFMTKNYTGVVKLILHSSEGEVLSTKSLSISFKVAGILEKNIGVIGLIIAVIFIIIGVRFWRQKHQINLFI